MYIDKYIVLQDPLGSIVEWGLSYQDNQMDNLQSII